MLPLFEIPSPSKSSSSSRMPSPSSSSSSWNWKYIWTLSTFSKSALYRHRLCHHCHHHHHLHHWSHPCQNQDILNSRAIVVKIRYIRINAFYYDYFSWWHWFPAGAAPAPAGGRARCCHCSWRLGSRVQVSHCQAIVAHCPHCLCPALLRPTQHGAAYSRTSNGVMGQIFTLSSYKKLKSVWENFEHAFIYCVYSPYSWVLHGHAHAEAVDTESEAVDSCSVLSTVVSVLTSSGPAFRLSCNKLGEYLSWKYRKLKHCHVVMVVFFL